MRNHSGAALDAERSWQVIEQERRDVADLLASLTDEEWERPSLCEGWRIRDVAVHVALVPNPPSTWQMLTEGLRAKGNFHRLNHDLSVRYANADVDPVAELRQHAASRRMPVVTNYRNILFDILVHVQDIAVPLGRTHEMPRDAAAAAATRVWRMGWPFWAKRRLKGLTLVATDVEWSVGHGTEVRGPIAALLLLLTGRSAALPSLSGAGMADLASRFDVRTAQESDQ